MGTPEEGCQGVGQFLFQTVASSWRKALLKAPRIVSPAWAAAMSLEKGVKEPPKRDAARLLLQEDDWTLSMQVLQEFFVRAITLEQTPKLAPKDL
jgi:hypothetical protein